MGFAAESFRVFFKNTLPRKRRRKLPNSPLLKKEICGSPGDPLHYLSHKAHEITFTERHLRAPQQYR